MGKFFGTYNRSLDEKNRLQLPSKLVGEMPKSLFLVRGFEGCLMAYLSTDFDKFYEKLGTLDYFDEESRHFVRIASSSVSECDVDAHGRLLLGKDVAASYHIGKEVSIIGAIDHFEIWDASAYEEYMGNHECEYERLAQSLSGRNDG